jgi:hypothetical protein
MTQLATVTVAGQGDIRQRLNSDGLAALGLGSPLLSPVWASAVPSASAATLDFTVAGGPWYAPLAGVLVGVPKGGVPGLSLLDGTPAAGGNAGGVVVFRLHPQARLRLERLFVLALQPAGSAPADGSLRPVPATVLIRNPGATVPTPLNLAAGDLSLPAGQVTFHDERGLIVDPFAFAAALAALIQNVPALGITAPAGTGTLSAVANLAQAGKFVHVVDLHGRPWKDPGASKGIGLYTGAANNRTPAGRIADGNLVAINVAINSGVVIAPEADPGDMLRPRAVDTVRVGWGTVGTLDTAALSWPAAGAVTPARDVLRVAAFDPSFHLLGNRTVSARDGVGRADDLSVAEQAPQVRDGSPISLLADGRAALGWFGGAILQAVQNGNPNAPVNTGPLLAATVAFDGDQNWPFPANPTANGRWPQNPAAVPVPGSRSAVLQQLEALRAGATASWIQGSNDVIVTLPATLPNGVWVRLYPIEVKLGVSPDEQPILVRHDGGGTFVQNGGQVVLTDPFRIGNANQPTPALLRVDAACSYLPTAGGPSQTLLLGNLQWNVSGQAARPAAANPNLLAINFWKGICSAPIVGGPSAGPFNLGQTVQQIVRQLTTDANPREAPRLPTMSRNESLFAVQVLNNADAFRGILTGGWLAREADTHAYKSANPGGVGGKEAHAPGVGASGQLGFDLWVAALHRCRPVSPFNDISGIPNLPNLPNNWVFLQSSASSAPPAPANFQTTCGAVLQTVPSFVETPELGLVPDDDVNAVVNWVNTKLGTVVTTQNDTELHRQMVREVRTCKYGRRDAQWALRRALDHARELVYIETPLLGHTKDPDGAPADPLAAVDLFAELTARLGAEPGLRVILLTPRTPPFPDAFAPWAMYFYAARNVVAQALQQAGGTIDGRPRVVVAHPMGIPGRPLVICTTTVVVDDVWCLVGTSTLSRRGLTFDGGNDVVMTDRALDRGAGVAVRAYRKALMAAHLGLSPGQGVPPAQLVQLHQPAAAHAVFADVLANGGEGSLLPLWPGPDPNAPNATIPHKAAVADPDGRGGASFITGLDGALGNNPLV